MARTDLKTVVSADMSQFSATMRKVGLQASATAGKVSKAMGATALSVGRLVGQATKAAGALALIGGTAAVGGMTAGLKAAADLGGGLSDLAARTGEAAGNLAVMQRALEDNGVSGDKAGTIINKMQKSIAELANGSDAAAKAFGPLGLSVGELTKLSPAKQFEAIGRAIAGINDPAQRAAAAMGIFGKSGGELLTLFADPKAFDGAGKFLGTQAEILNRSSATFDSISDKLARIPAKLQGFFVGFLEPIAGPIDKLLERFETIDFAAIGQRFASSLSLENVAKLVSAAIPLMTTAIADAFAKALDIAGALMRAMFSVEGLGFLKNNLIDVVVSAFDAIGGAAAQLSKTLLSAMKGEQTFYDNTRIIGREKTNNGPKSFAQQLEAELAKIDFAPSNSLKDAAQKFGVELGAIFPKVTGQKGPGQSPQGDIYAAEAEAQRKRVAAEMGDRRGFFADGTLMGPSNPFSQFGPSRDLMSNNAKIAERLRKRSAEEAASGFRGLAERSNMQADMIAGNGPGSSLSRDRKGGRWSSSPGASASTSLVTGGLGERRRLRTSKDDKDAKKGLSLQERQVGLLESMNGNLAKAVTVS